MSHVDFKKSQCRLSLFFTMSCVKFEEMSVIHVGNIFSGVKMW